MDDPSPITGAHGPGRSVAFPLENPFSLKIGQIFTGIGVGCGVGIGVGKPIYLGAIPMLQPVLSATRGATDVFSGVGKHVNNSLNKIGMKNIEAGVGCGVGVGHGFGVGIALKPRVLHQIQSALVQALAKIMTNLRIDPSLSAVQSIIPGSAQSGTGMLTGTSSINVQTSVGSVLDLASKTTGSTFQDSRRNVNSQGSTHDFYGSKATSSVRSMGSRSEMVINTFLQNPALENEKDMQLDERAGKLHLENNVLLMLMKHQQLIEELMDENQKLRQILVDDLKVPPSKLEESSASRIKLNSICSDCLDCRRRNRKSAR